MIDASAFPEDFMWGVAAAAYQIEGAAAEGGRKPSIWDTVSHTPGRVDNGDTGDVAVDHYHRYREDVAIMRDLGVDAYRFSVSWSRVLPDGVGRTNPEGIDFYRRLCTELLDAGITPVATLYHWDLPQTLQTIGGWLDGRSPAWFAEYAAVVKEALGDLVQVWTTLNEPWCAAFLGHSSGEHAPGMTDPGSGFVAAHHLMLAHHAGIATLRRTRPREDDRLGVVLNLIPAWPATDSPGDVEAAAGIDDVQNWLFSEAVMRGRYPQRVLDLHRRYRVDDVIDPAELAAARQDIDYLGVNYSTINHIAHRPGTPGLPAWPGADGAQMARPPGRLTEMDWGVEPEGLTWILERTAAAYPGTPLMVCENGAAYPDAAAEDGRVDDQDRIAYLEGHIAAVAEAIDRGVDVDGYFVWSLLDNFEWAKGYEKRFGIVRVDFATMERTLKASGRWYGDFLARQAVAT